VKVASLKLIENLLELALGRVAVFLHEVVPDAEGEA